MYQSATHAMEMCVGNLTDIHEIADMIDFDISQLISMIIVGSSFRASILSISAHLFEYKYVRNEIFSDFFLFL